MYLKIFSHSIELASIVGGAFGVLNVRSLIEI